MREKMKRAAALCLLTLSLLALTACGGGGEKTVVGEVFSLNDREAVICPLSAEKIPGNEAFGEASYVMFSTEVLDNFTVQEGDVVSVLCRGDIPEGDTIWMEAMSWSLYQPGEGAE